MQQCMSSRHVTRHNSCRRDLPLGSRSAYYGQPTTAAKSGAESVEGFRDRIECSVILGGGYGRIPLMPSLGHGVLRDGQVSCVPARETKEKYKRWSVRRPHKERTA